jgi:hypothetical protein
MSASPAPTFGTVLSLRLTGGEEAGRPADATLELHLDGWDAVWALRRRLVVPVGHVAAARAVPRRELPSAGLRMGGTEMPRRIRAGRYWWPGSGWSFWFIRRADEVLLIDLRDDRYERLVVEVDDPQEWAAEIRRAAS